jgi:Fe-Mn family superoxide dismutase
MYKNITRYSSLIASAILLASTTFYFYRYYQSHTPKAAPIDVKNVQQENASTAAQYTARLFNLENVLKGLSKKQIEQHEELYRGYVKQRNNIAQQLKTVDRSGPNRTYSPFRELKVEETYAVNGHLLHELYFENLGKSGDIGPLMKELIENNFGSLEAFKKDLMDCAQISRGWVITAYGLDDGALHNYVLEQHNQNVPILALPLLVLDVYEHAYMIDFGINRNLYLDIFWENINWEVVENRIVRWVNVFHN